MQRQKKEEGAEVPPTVPFGGMLEQMPPEVGFWCKPVNPALRGNRGLLCIQDQPGLRSKYQVGRAVHPDLALKQKVSPIRSFVLKVLLPPHSTTGSHAFTIGTDVITV